MALDTIEVARAEIAQIYIAAFNRVPDAAGLSNWMNQYMAGKMTYAQIAEDFTRQPEYTAKYPSIMTNTEYVTEIYNNVFGRTPDAGGLVNWVNQLDHTSITGINRGNIMTYMLASAGAPGNTDGERLDNQAAFAVQSILDGVPEATATAQLANITSDDATVTAATAAVSGSAGGVLGSTFTLTTGANTFTGTTNNDTFKAGIDVVIDPATGTQTNVDTLQAVDTLVGGTGTDTLNYTTAGTVALGSISEIEVMNVESLAGLTINTSAITDLTNLNITKVGTAGAIVATAAGTTDVNVTMAAKGAAVGIVGGNDVNVALTGIAAAADVVTIGTGTNPTGAVTVSMTGAAYTTTAGDHALSAINVTGGTTINVTQKATSDASAAVTDTGADTVTQGAVNVVASASTTAVVIKQDTAIQEKVAVAAVAGTTTTQSITFGAMTAGEVYSLDMGAGIITFTAKTALTAAQAASAFANLIAGDDQGNASATLGLYSDNGANVATDTWASASVVTVDATHSKVVFSTSLSTETAIADNTSTAAAGITVGAVVAGVDAVTAVAGHMGITAGAVSITANASDALTSITLDSYGTGSSTTATTKLATLNLSNVAEAVTLTVADTADTLALTLQNVGYDLNVDDTIGDAVLTFTAAPTTLNITSTGKNYVNLTAAATTTLNVSGTGTLRASATDLAGLTTVVVSESAGVSLNAGVANTVTSVNTSATTGATTVTIEGGRATYTGGAGVDTVTLATDTALTKAIDLGAGDDTLSFAALNVTGSTATLSGGAGTDTLSMATATADALDATAQTFYTNFERLKLNDSAATATVNLENLGFTSYVTTSGSAGTLTLDNLANNGTVVLGAAATATVVNIKDATTGLTDVLNVVTNAATTVNLGTLTAAKVETINVTVNDTDTTSTAGVPNVSTNTMVINADKATLVDLGGAGNLVLTFNAASTEVAAINASDMTGKLTVTTLAVDTGATTVTGGSANDSITLAGANDVAIGGAGNDTLIVTGSASAVTLTGGTGTDKFDVSAFTAANPGAAVTITDIAAGEQIIFKNGLDGMNFASGKVTLIAESTFTEYVTEAAAKAELATETFYDATVAADTYEGGISWFQFNNNTFIVQDVNGDGAFTDGTDIIVKLTGTIDLSTASFNTTNGSLEIA